MLLRYASRPFGTSVRRVLSTSASRASVQAAEISKYDDYYKTIAEVDESRPPNWDTAKPFEEIPGPKPLPIIGNMWRFMPVFGEYYQIPIMDMFNEFQREYGNVVSLKGIPGRTDCVHLFDPDDMENLLRNSGNFPLRITLDAFVHYRTVERRDVFQDVGGLLTVQGEEWFKMRSMVNPILMQPRTIHQFIDKLDDVAGEMVNNMRTFARRSKNRQMPDNFVEELHKWALESVGIMALNKRLGCLDMTAPDDSEPKRLVSAVLKMFYHLYLFEMQLPIWKYVSTPTWRNFVNNMNYITDIIIKYLDKAFLEPIDESVPEQQLSVLQRLGKKNKKIAFAMVTDMLVAGLDTTGKTMGAILYFLARNPDKQSKLREEIFKNLPEKNTPITAEILGKSPYLKGVIKESNRIAPVAIGGPRTTVKELVLGGYQIPKGTNITVVSIHPANSAENFKDPRQYIPERWLRETSNEYSAKNAHPFASLPFGYGPRSCVGRRFANLELELMIINIIRNFELSWEHQDMEFASYFLYGINHPLKLTVKELD